MGRKIENAGKMLPGTPQKRGRKCCSDASINKLWGFQDDVLSSENSADAICNEGSANITPLVFETTGGAAVYRLVVGGGACDTKTMH